MNIEAWRQWIETTNWRDIRRWEDIEKPDTANWVYPHNAADRRREALTRLPGVASALEALAVGIVRPGEPPSIRDPGQWQDDAVSAMSAVAAVREVLAEVVWTGPDPNSPSAEPDTITWSRGLPYAMRRAIIPDLDRFLKSVERFIMSEVVPGAGEEVEPLLCGATPLEQAQRVVGILSGFAADLRERGSGIALRGTVLVELMGQKEALAYLEARGVKARPTPLHEHGDKGLVKFTLHGRRRMYAAADLDSYAVWYQSERGGRTVRKGHSFHSLHSASRISAGHATKREHDPRTPPDERTAT